MNWKVMGWKPMRCAPQDEEIWVYYDHEQSDIYNADKSLTVYGHYVQEGGYYDGTGQCTARWGGGYSDEHVEFPNWWICPESGMEAAVWPIAWRELPNPPTEEELAGGGDDRGDDQ